MTISIRKYYWVFIAISTSWYYETIAEAAAEFYYFSREFPTEKMEIKTNQNHNLINGSRPIKFIIHGWGESSERPYYKEMTNEFLYNDDVDVIQVDWNVQAGKTYLISASNTKNVGAHIANLITNLAEKVSVSTSLFDQVHLIGHSLGAHVAGHAGRKVFEQTGHQVGRISGLDPAGPHFDTSPPERLAPADATFVDITHTDGNFFGINEAIGHVDFYPNGGIRPQPGCELLNPKIYQMSPTQIGFCSHTKSYQYFIESINKESFQALRCDNYVNFKKGLCIDNEQIVYGEHAQPNAVGKYYFDTTSVLSLTADRKQHALAINNKSNDILHSLIKIVV